MSIDLDAILMGPLGDELNMTLQTWHPGDETTRMHVAALLMVLTRPHHYQAMVELTKLAAVRLDAQEQEREASDG